MTAGTEQLITELGGLSYAGIWLTSFLANVIIPVPEEVVLLGIGYIVGTGSFNGYAIIPLVISGLLASDIIIYILSRRGSRLVTWFYEKFFAKRLASKGDAWVGANIAKIIIFSRFLLQLRFIGPFIAGQRKIDWRTFVVYDLLALVIYVPLYILLGVYFQNKVTLIIGKVEVLRNIILIGVGLLLLYGSSRIAYRWFFKRYAIINGTAKK